jgi:glyoxylase-like metal-dependent hydrolase (beta-lactamase superfamily II)
MTAIPFVTLAEPRYGEAVQVSPAITRVVAHNPSKFTYHGTGTYIVGAGRDVVVIDPGPRLDAHRDALAAALEGRRVAAVLVTHCHADHSPLAAWLAEHTGAPTVGFGAHPRPTEADAAATDEDDDDDDETDNEAGDDSAEAPEPVAMEESTDFDFVPTVHVADGEVAAEIDGVTMRAVHTPGHTSNHLCFAFEQERALFSGDHVMGWSTTVIAPPDGDMRAYFESLHRVAARNDATLWPTHGAPVTDPQPFLAAFLAHRLGREAQVLAAVRGGQTSIAAMVKVLYADVRKELHKPARRSVLSHLVKLVDDGLVAVADGGRPTLRATYLPA